MDINYIKAMFTKNRPNMSVLLVAAFLFLFQTAFASVPQVKTQTPGYFRMMLGDFEVTALVDGQGSFGTDVLTNIHPKEVQSILRHNFLPDDRLSVSVTAYLVNTGDHLLLIDAGAGGFWQGLGNLMGNLKAAGYSPDQVDQVLLTHLHADHVGGLLTGDGKRAFPNADIRLAQEENDFWLSETNREKAPDMLKGMFVVARAAASLYQAEGRWKPFTGCTELVPGVQPVFLPGHTAGHTGYRFKSKGKLLLIWGDLVHNAAVQIVKPKAAFAFDADSAAAIHTRYHLFRYAVREGLMVAGSHMPYPGIGHIQRVRGLCHWVPVEYSAIP